jgi:hypothetical protein
MMCAPLGRLLRPRSIAVVGASDKPGALGAQPMPAKSGIDEPPVALGEHTAMTKRRRVLRA